MSDNELYPLPSTCSESRRLEQQSSLYGGVAFLEPFLAQQPRRVLDLGCGTGHFAARVAAELGSSAVIGVDIDLGRLAASASVGRPPLGSSRPRAQQADICALPFADGSFDLAYARFVLLFQPDPLAALREVLRVLRPGGQLVVYDMVHDGVWFSPPSPAFSEALKWIVSALRERGLEPNQGLHLAGALRRAGFAAVEVRPMPQLVQRGDPSFEAHLDNWRQTLISVGQQLKAIDAELVAEALAELDSGAPELLLETALLAWGSARSV
jgi:SAM-dependent methyltransferase